MAHLLIFAILSILYVTTSAEDRAHGLGNESPSALSPSAYTFFHPIDAQPPSTNSLCVSSDCSSSLSLAAQQSSHETPSTTDNKQLAARGIVGIPLVFIFACLVTAGVYYVVIKRRANSRRANPQHEDKV